VVVARYAAVASGFAANVTRLRGGFAPADAVG
jgi:hypothetical protein